MLDDTTRDACAQVEAYARRNGKDLFESLADAGLLVTKEKRSTIQQVALAWLLVQLEEQPDTALATLGGAQTVTGAVNGVKRFIELSAQTMKTAAQ